MPEQFIKDDMNDLIEEVHQVQLLLNKESGEDENKNDEAFSMGDPHPFGDIEDVFADTVYYHWDQRFSTQISRNSQWDSIKIFVARMRIYYPSL